MIRGVNLRTNANVISPSSFQSRKAYLVAGYKDGSFLAEPENRGKPPANPMSDPAMMEGMMGMMKGNVAMMVPQTLIMGWINAFFSGFVISTSVSFLHVSWTVPDKRTVAMPHKADGWKCRLSETLLHRINQRATRDRVYDVDLLT